MGGRLRLVAVTTGLVLTGATLIAPVARASTFAVTATIATSGTSAPAYANGFLVIASSSNVYLFNATTNILAHTIPVSGASTPQGTAVIGSTVYIANQGSSSVTVVNTVTQMASVISTPTCSGPERLLVVSTRIYANCTSNAKVIAINTLNNTVSATLSVGNLPRRMAYAGGYVYVPNENSNSVTIITDAASPTVAATVAVGSMPVGSTDYGSKAYIVNYVSNTVSVFQGTSVVATIPVGSFPQMDVACGNYVVVANRNAGSASFIDPTTDTVTMTVTGVGVNVTHSVQANAGFAYFADFGANTVTAVDCGTGTLAGSITVTNPSEMAFNGSSFGYFPEYSWSPISVAQLPSSTGTSGVNELPRPWLKQVGRVPGAQCETGWGASWAQWPNGYTGGWVCTQTHVWSTALNQYVLD